MGLLDVLNRLGEFKEANQNRRELGPDFRGIIAGQIAEREMQDRTRTFVEQNARISSERNAAKQKEEQLQTRISNAVRSTVSGGAFDVEDETTTEGFEAGEADRITMEREDEKLKLQASTAATKNTLATQQDDFAQNEEAEELSLRGSKANVASAEIRAKFGEQQVKQRIKLNADQIARNQDGTADANAEIAAKSKEANRIFEASNTFFTRDFSALVVEGTPLPPEAEASLRDIEGQMFDLHGDDFDAWPKELINILRARHNQRSEQDQ